MTVEKALRTLQSAIRSNNEIDFAHGYRSGRLPQDLQTDDVTEMTIGADESSALDAAAAVMRTDERFEYMSEKEIESALWRFAALAWLQREPSHVKSFVAQHARAPDGTRVLHPDSDGHTANIVETLINPNPEWVKHLNPHAN